MSYAGSVSKFFKKYFCFLIKKKSTIKIAEIGGIKTLKMVNKFIKCVAIPIIATNVPKILAIIPKVAICCFLNTVDNVSWVE